MNTGSPIASIDVDAHRTFLEELRGRRVALRSFIPRDDIDDIEIVEAEDPEVSATRQVLKVEAVERTGEIDAIDVLESIDIVGACAPPEVAATPLVVTPLAATPLVVTPPTTTATATAPLAVFEARATFPAIDEDDAFFAVDPPSTGPVTFHLGDGYVDEIGPTMELRANERRRRLGWIVGTVIACAVVMVAAAAVTEHTQAAPREAAASNASANAAATTATGAIGTSAFTSAPASAPASTPASATTNAHPVVPEVDVSSLPQPLAGTIVGVAKRPLFVDGKRLKASTAVVTCGKHTVRSGAFRPSHVVDVPCGGSISLR